MNIETYLAINTLITLLAFNINYVTYPGKEHWGWALYVSLFWPLQVVLWLFGTYLEHKGGNY